MKKGYLFFICGVTWSWKWTLIKGLIEKKFWNLEFILSCKTREARVWEIVWKDYIKLSKEEFKNLIEKNEFLEYNFVHNQDYYWTRKVDVIDNWIEKWKNLLKEIDMLIVPTVLEKLKDLRKNFSIIFLELPIDLIKTRMIERWEKIDSENYKNRVDSAIKETELKRFADLIVDATKSKEEVLAEVEKYILTKI